MADPDQREAMRALLVAVGTRGDVQPALALALELRKLGHEVRMCISPNFVEWAKSLGLEALPMGVEMRMPAQGAGATPTLTPEVLRRLMASAPDLISDQFETIGAAVDGCDVYQHRRAVAQHRQSVERARLRAHQPQSLSPRHGPALCCGIEAPGNTALYWTIRRWLDGPVDLERPHDLSFRGSMTIADVHSPQREKEYPELIRRWAMDVWQAYAVQQGMARQWLEVVRLHGGRADVGRRR